MAGMEKKPEKPEKCQTPRAPPVITSGSNFSEGLTAKNIDENRGGGGISGDPSIPNWPDEFPGPDGDRNEIFVGKKKHYMDVSENRGFSPQIIHFNRVFDYKPSILGYPYFWKHPYQEEKKKGTCNEVTQL